MKKFLSVILAVAMMAMLLVGCGGKNGSTTSGDVSSASTYAEGETLSTGAVFAGGWPYSTPPTGHFNMFVANCIELKYYRELHQLPLATYNASTDTYDPMLAQEWNTSEDGTTFTVKLREDAKWMTGEAFTAKDVWTTFMMYRLVNNAVWSYISDVTVDSDNEVSFAVSTPSVLVLRQVLRKPMVDYTTYGEYAEKVDALLKAGLGEDSVEWTALVEEFNNFRPETVNATGPYYLDVNSISESSIELKKNENSCLADQVKFDKIVVYNGDVPDLTPLVLNGEIDFLTHVFPAASVATFEQMGYQMRQVAGRDGLAMYFNESVKPLDQVEVRQAIAHVVDRVRVGEVALAGITEGTKYLTGMCDTLTEDWVDTSKLISYNVDTEKAAALLEQAGLTKGSDGKWYLSDGKKFTISLQCPASWSDASTAATEIAQELTAFGIETKVDGIDSTMRQSNISEGQYQVALSFFGNGQPHPMYSYEVPLLLSNANAPVGLKYPMVQETESCGTVDLNQLLVDTTSGWDKDAQKEAVEKIALTINETVPYIPLYVKNAKYVTSEGMRTDWGEDDSLYMNSAGDDSFVVIKILRGELGPKQK